MKKKRTVHVPIFLTQNPIESLETKIKQHRDTPFVWIFYFITY